MNVKAAILAGGRGTRFKPYTEIIAKPMIPIGKKEKPILEHILNWLKRNGIREYVFLIGYRGQQIRNYFGHGERWNVKIQYSEDTSQYKDTGGALLNAYKKGLLNTETTLVWYGDIIADINIRKLLQHHQTTKADATLALADKYQLPVGVAELAPDGRITMLKEKPWIPIKVSIGILAIKTNIIGRAEQELGGTFDIMAHLIPWMIKNNHNIQAYIHTGYWYDIGSLERYAKLDNHKLEETLGQFLAE